MKVKLLLISLTTTLFIFSGCDFGVEPDLSPIFGGGLWSYFPVDTSSRDTDYNSVDTLNTTPSSIYIEANAIVVNTESSATLYFSAIADTTVVLNRISGKLAHLEIVNGSVTSRGIKYNIVSINTKNCLQDISIKPDSILFEMKKDNSYNFCFVIDQLERDTHYYLNVFFYYYILSNELKGIDSCSFIHEFDFY